METQQQEWFSNWFDSPYYPVLYAHRDEAEAAQFVDSLMEYLRLPGDSIVADMACGEGRYAYQLSKYVAKVIGFDLSAARIQKAQEQFAGDRVLFYEHDMRAPMHVNYFDAIFNFFTSFGYFNTYRDHLNAARSLSNGLKKGGLLVIDYFNNVYVKNKLVAEEQIIKGNIIFDIKRYVSEGKIVKEIVVRDGNAPPLHFEERVSDVSVERFKLLFEKAGLQLENIFGDYRLSSFDREHSPRLIMIFRK